MNKFRFFWRLNRRHRLEGIILFLVFTFSGIVMADAQLIHQNNDVFFHAQMLRLGIEAEEQLKPFLDSVENILNVFSVISVLVAAWGGFGLVFYRDISMQKTYAVCRMYGMALQDLLKKSLNDAFVYGMGAGIAGIAPGYLLFQSISRRVCGIEAAVRIWEWAAVFTCVQVCLVLGTAAFFASLAAGILVSTDKIMNVFRDRREKRDYKKSVCAGIMGLSLLLLELYVLHKQKYYIYIIFIVFLLIILILIAICRLVFYLIAKHGRNRKALTSVKGISYRFLCSRYRKDAFLAAMASVGALVICFILNVIGNISGVLEAAYRENVGYTTAVWMEQITDADGFAEKLHEKGIAYTKVYSKLMDYAALCSGMEGQFYVCVIEEDTIKNASFYVPEGIFLGENLFAGRTGITEGAPTDLFGKELIYGGAWPGNQYLFPLSFNVLINESGWQLEEMDASYLAVFLLDPNSAQKQQLKEIAVLYPCDINTAASLIDEIIEIFGQYISIIVVIGVMIILVTGSFLYSMIQNDLLHRQRECYLYQIYGASAKQVEQVVFYEYMMIAVLSAFCVSFLVMGVGELFFVVMLGKNYPVSILIAAGVVVCSGAFVMACCMLAGHFTSRSGRYELLRDE